MDDSLDSEDMKRIEKEQNLKPQKKKKIVRKY